MSAAVGLATVLRRGAPWIALAALAGAGLAGAITWWRPPRHQITAELRLLRPADPMLFELGVPTDLAGVQTLFFSPAVRDALAAGELPARYGVDLRAPEGALRWAQVYTGGLTVAAGKSPTSVFVLTLDQDPERGALLVEAAIHAARDARLRELRAALVSQHTQTRAAQAAALDELRGLAVQLAQARQVERGSRRALATQVARHWRVQAERLEQAGEAQAAATAQRSADEATREVARLAYVDLDWTSVAATRLEADRLVLLERYTQHARRASLLRELLAALPEPWVVETRDLPARRALAPELLPIVLWGLASAAGTTLLLLARAGQRAG
jgi:hypothetical protein